MEVSNKSFDSRFFTTKNFDIITKQPPRNCKIHSCTNASFSLERRAEKYFYSQMLQRRKHALFQQSSLKQCIGNRAPVSWGNLVALNGSSQLSPLEMQVFLNRHFTLSRKREKRASSYQKKKLGLRSQTSIHPDGGFVSQSGENLSYDTNCEHSKIQLNQATSKAKGYLLDGYGWKVRDFDPKNEDDLQAIAEVQAKAFYSPFAVFNDFLFNIFKAEVLSALIYKIRHSLPKRYTCLLAEPLRNEHTIGAFFSKETNNIIGVVDLTALGEREIVKCLSGTDEYLYLSGLAVESAYRRKSVATLLLQASVLKALDWGFKYLVLHAYEDDTPARRLYSTAGFQVIWKDPLWTSKWLGRQRRVAMAKRVLSES